MSQGGSPFSTTCMGSSINIGGKVGFQIDLDMQRIMQTDNVRDLAHQLFHVQRGSKIIKLKRRQSGLLKPSDSTKGQKIAEIVGESMKKKIDLMKRKNSASQMRQLESFDSQQQSQQQQHNDLFIPGLPIESLKILQQFKVPIGKLKLVPTTEGKIDFLIDHMQNHIKDQIRQLNQQEAESKQSIKMFKKQMKDQFNDDHFKGLYSWLKVNTPQHQGLIKKLRTKLIESLQTQDLDKMPRSARFNAKQRHSEHYQRVIKDNPGHLLISGGVLHEAVEKTFKDFVRSSLDQETSNPMRSSKSTQKLKQEPVKTFKRLNDMMRDIGEEESCKNKKRPKTAVKHTNDEEEGQDKSQGLKGAKFVNDAVQKFFDTLPDQSWDAIREREKRQQIEALMKQFSIEEKSAYSLSKFEWDPKLEQLFQSHKKEIRLGLTKHSSTGPWNKVVLGEMDQLRQDLPKTTSQKDLQKAYSNLKYNKVQEIVNTIPSLNECLDKKGFQKSVNHLPKEEMNKIETQIAEDILWTYSRKKYHYQSARNQFFKSKISTSAEKIKQNEAVYQNKRESVQRRKEYKKLSKRYRTILSGLQQGKISLKENKNDPLVNRLYKSGLHHFKEPQHLKMQQPKDMNDLVNTRIALDQFQTTGKVNSQPKYDRRVPQKYFIEKYAGGPSSNEESRKPVSMDQLMRAAVRIQSWARIVLAKKIAREKKQELQRQRFIYEENLKRQQQKAEKDNFYRQSTLNMEEENHTQYSHSPDTTKKASKGVAYRIDTDVFYSLKGPNEPQLLTQNSVQSSALNRKNLSSSVSQPNIRMSSRPLKAKHTQDLYKSKAVDHESAQKTFKTDLQLKKNLQLVMSNMFNACRKNNYTYLEKNRDRLTLKILQTTKDSKGNTPLYVSVANKCYDTVKYLLDRGVPANSKNENGNTPLHRAFMNQDYQMIGLLQDRGANFDAINDYNQTPMFFGSRKLVEKLGLSNKPVNFVEKQEQNGKSDHHHERVQHLIRVKFQFQQFSREHHK